MEVLCLPPPDYFLRHLLLLLPATFIEIAVIGLFHLLSLLLATFIEIAVKGLFHLQPMPPIFIKS